MFISESVLSRGITGNINSLALLESMSYLEESSYHPAMVPIVENSRLNAYVVDVEDILRLSEETGIEFDDAVISVAESNGIDAEDVILSIDEVTAYENDGIEDLLNESIFYCVKKVLPQNDFVYNLMEAVVNEAWETGDYDFIMEAALFNQTDKDVKDNFVKKIYNSAPLKHIPNKAKGYVAATTDVAAGMGGAMALDIGGGAIAAGLGAGPIGASIAGIIAALPALVHAYHAGGRLGVSIRDKFVTKKSKDFGEGVYFDKSVEKLKKIAQGIDNNPRSYSVRAVSSLEKLQTKWANNMQSASDPKQKSAIAKFVDAIGQAISAAKIKIAGEKGKKTKGVHEAFLVESDNSQNKGIRDSIADKLKRAKDWAQGVIDKIDKLPANKKGIFTKLKLYIVKFIRWITDTLETFIRPVRFAPIPDTNKGLKDIAAKEKEQMTKIRGMMDKMGLNEIFPNDGNGFKIPKTKEEHDKAVNDLVDKMGDPNFTLKL